MSLKAPKFLRILYSLLHTESPTIIAWSPCGTFFQVIDVARLEQSVLPRYFKHNKFASFQRQLNNFGFRKWTKTRASVCTFSHDVLVRCQPSALPMLMRGYQPPSSVAAVSTSYKRARDEMESGSFAKKSKMQDKVASVVDISELSVSDWSVRGEEDLYDELSDNDDCVGLPIELFFSAETKNSVFEIEPLAFGDACDVDASEWQVLAECLA